MTVLVAGAGPTGLTMANELLRHGVPVRLIDKSPAASDKSRAWCMRAASRSSNAWASPGASPPKG